MRNGKGQFQNMREDLTGQRFGRLVALHFSHKDRNRKTYWDFMCDCGEIKTLRSDGVKSGRIRSCGCLKAEQDVLNMRTERRLDKTIPMDETYVTLGRRWAAMKSRCYDTHSPMYKHYGARGIQVCDEWLYSFRNYYNWCIENGYDKSLELDRRNNDGNYEPSNCRFVTHQVNMNNTRVSKACRYRDNFTDCARL
ncbi:MAG: hypothetical protein IKY90_07080 [Oscillospiraceae bacterium]|nr:hypothetical protein [Oscillospiraceae bacterium]